MDDEYVKDERSALVQQAIVYASLYGSGTRDSTGCTTESNFIANRGGTSIEYVEESCMAPKGRVRITRGSSTLVHLERGEGDLEAGLILPLSYTIKKFSPLEQVREALYHFEQGLQPIGRKGDLLPTR